MLLGALMVASRAQDKPVESSSRNQNASLERVLSQLDATAASFRTAQADFVWDQYQKVVNETDTQKGKVYFRRVGKDTQMMAHITEPAEKYVLYSDGKVQVYEPKIDQVTVYSAGKNRADVESFLVLGFGGRGHDLLKSFDVKLLGHENIDGTETAKLDLVPKSERIRGMFEHILMWVDLARGVSVQQQVFQPGGDYRLAKYSNIQLNQKLPDNVFKLKTTGKTKVVTPQG
jgi:outer membrane lipoprotein-sorting protein